MVKHKRLRPQEGKHKDLSVHERSQRIQRVHKETGLDITNHVDGGAGHSSATLMDCHTGELPSAAQVDGGGVDVQPCALTVCAVPGLPVACYTARAQQPGLSISAFELPAQLQGEGGEACRLALDA